MDQEIQVRLAREAGQRDEVANRRLAAEIAGDGDEKAVSALVDLATSAKTRIASDAIKVLGEVASRRPELLTEHVDALAEQVTTRTGAFVWEGMAVLAGVAQVAPDAVGPHLGVISNAMKGPSVIARDRGVKALIALVRAGVQPDGDASVLLDTLRTCPVNQLPAYAEQIAAVAGQVDPERLRPVLEGRAADAVQPAKAKRIDAVLRSLA